MFLGTGILDIPVIGPSTHNLGGTDYQYNGLWLSGFIRASGMAQPGTLSGSLGEIGSTATYLSSALNATPDKIVQSVETSIAVAYQKGEWVSQRNGGLDVGQFVATSRYAFPSTLFTASFIASVGAITPFSAAQSNPPVYYLTQQIISAYPTITFPASCSPVASTPTCYFSFVPTDRTHFYRNYQAGVRLKAYGSDYADDPTSLHTTDFQPYWISLLGKTNS